jgi:hypothetical protein
MATIDELQIEIQASAKSASSGIDALTASLSGLRGAVKGGAGLTTVSKQFERFSAAMRSMTDPSAKIASLVSGLAQLSSIGKSNLGSTLNQLNKIPTVMAGLKGANLREFYNQIQSITRIMRPLAAEMEKVSLGFSHLPANIQRAINANARLTTSNRSTSKSFSLVSGGTAKLTAAYFVATRIGRTLAGWITESNDYVENLNLFTVAMGEYAESAQAYAEQVGEAMGIDPSEWMRNQGVFQTLLTGFGNAADKAAVMSKNLTQLGYDLSSFFNISFADSMQKLQSGIAGELEPLRRLGYDLSVARLEQEALNLGITKSVNAMTQAEKAQLRYYAIMTQVTTAQGDMARTLQAPANQLRIFQSQLTQASRALGNIYIPALNAVLPYAIAFLKVHRTVANEIANTFGFALPEIDYSSVNGLASGGEEVADAFSDAADEAKRLSKNLLGIDELNVLQSNTTAVAGASVGSDLGLNLPEYDFLGGALDNRVNELAEKLEKPFKDVLGIVAAIGGGILAWKIGKSVLDFATMLKGFGKSGKITLGVTMALTGFTLEAQGFASIGAGNAQIMDYVKAAIGSALGIAGSVVVLGSNPVGWTIGILAALSVGLVSFEMGQLKSQMEFMTSDFFDGVGTTIDIFNTRLLDMGGAASEARRNIINMYNTVEENNAKIADAQSTLEFYQGILGTTGKVTSEQAGTMQDSFNTLISSMRNNLQTNASIIFEAFKNSSKDAAKKLGLDVGEMTGILQRFQSTFSSKTDELETKMQPFWDKLKAGKVLSPTEEKEFGRLIDYATDLGTAVSETQVRMKSQLGDISKIDFANVDEAAGKIKEIQGTAKTMLGELDGSKIAADTAIENLKRQAGVLFEHGDLSQSAYDQAIKTFSKYSVGIQKGYDDDKAAINKELTSSLGAIQSAFDAQVKATASKAKPTWFQALIGSYDGTGNYAKSKVEEKLRKELAPIQEAIDGAMLTLKIKTDKTQVKQFMDTMSEYGRNSAQGYINGIAQKKGDTDAAGKSVFDDFKLGVHKSGKFGSPSQVMFQYGGWSVDGFRNGVNDKRETVVSAFTSMFNSILGKLDTFTQRFRTAINDTLGGMTYSMNNISIGSNGKLSFTAMPKVTIPKFAQGGYPVPGELFLAREAGAEMVGSVGGRTAVANNDQIVDAVSQGVYRAVRDAMSGSDGGTVEASIGFDDIADALTVRVAKRLAAGV